MYYNVTTQPGVEPVSLIEAKDHLRVDITADDTLITSQIKAARVYCEGVLNRAMITQTVTAYFDNFQDMKLPLDPVQSITSVKYYDSDNVQQTLDSGVYELDNDRIILAYEQSWPALRGHANSVEVVYTAGYGDAGSDVPATMVQAVKLVLGHLYENRENSAAANLKTIPLAARSLLSLDARGIV